MDNNKINTEDILSPCQDKCKNDFENTYCIVCMRTVEEKKNWWRYNKEEKLKIIEDLKTRKHR